MPLPTLSIIIPTHKRPQILQLCLEHLANQTIKNQLEVIVVHDGEDDEATKALFTDPNTQHLKPTTYLSIPKSQQGTARNQGVQLATAPIVLFLDDDILLDEEACEVHVQAHSSIPRPLPPQEEGGTRPVSPSPVERGAGGEEIEKIAVLGFMTWDPTVGITPVMRWLEKTGWELGFNRIERFANDFLPQAIQHRFTYTGQLSIPRTIALAHPFSETSVVYGWEDILWGTHLREDGIRLFYARDAKGLHHQKMTLEDSLRRMRKIGQALQEMQMREPHFDRIPHGMKLLAYRLAALLPTIGGKHRKAFLQGLNGSNP